MDTWMWIVVGIAGMIIAGMAGAWLANWLEAGAWLASRLERRGPVLECSGAGHGPDDCPGLGISTAGHEMLVGLVLGELTLVETQATLGHLESCMPCAEKLRVIITLHCGPLEGDVVHLTPDKLRRLRERSLKNVQ